VAKNAKKPTKKSSSTDENVVRIKAGASSKRAEKTTTAPASKTEVKEKPAKTTIKKSDKGIRGLGFLSGIGGYFKGAWQELRLVRWPTRGATWSLTFAVLAYSAFFVVLVLLLDAAFKYLFELILGK
jgi:preprotein translocase subunit SecE